jgi:hypothetical protein
MYFAEMESWQIAALWRFGTGLQQKTVWCFGAMPTPATGQTLCIQGYQSGPVIALA